MSFSITNNSADSVISGLSTESSTYGTFTITSGSFPLLSGQTISGTNTEINNSNGSPYGTIQLFVQQGSAQIEVYINGTLYSANDYSSGIASVQVPILQSSDVLDISIDESELPVPSSTPSVTPTNTPTGTPNVTPTPSTTPPVPLEFKLQEVYNYPQDDTTKTTGSTQFYYAKVGNGDFVQLTKRDTVSNLNNRFSGTGFSEISTGSTMNLILSANVSSQGFYLTGYGGNGSYDEQRLTGFTWNGTNRWTGTTGFYSGGTLVYTETGGFIQLDSINKIYTVGGTFGSYPDTGYFYVMPNP